MGRVQVRDRQGIFAFASLQLDRSMSPVATLSSADAVTSGRLGIAADSVARFIDLVDGTGLTGAFDLKLTWPADDRFVGRGASASPTIFTAIQEQLGLRLQAGRGPVEMLIVDRAERPVPD